MKQIYSISIALLALSSCTKELDFDYSSVDPMYVVEAYVTNFGTEAKVTMTQDVMATNDAATVDDATLTITGTDSTYVILTPCGKGVYASSLKGTPGVTYTLMAKMGNITTESQSTMPDSVVLDSCGFAKEKMMGNDYFLFKTYMEDDGMELRNYLIRLYRNGENYKYSARQNKQSLHGTLLLQTSCYTNNPSASDDTKQKNWLYDGDIITGYVTRIDNSSYDYFTSWANAERNNSNPLSNFSNGVLGVFSAQYITPFPQITFREADVPDNQ